MARKVLTELKAKQVFPVQLPDGQNGIIMVASDGGVYTYLGEGWKKLSMIEVEE